MTLNNIRLSAKLWLATGLIVLSLGLVTGFTAMRSGADQIAANAALKGFNTKIRLTQQWAALTATNAARSQAVLLSSDPGVEAGLKGAIAATWAQIDDIQKLIDATQLTSADRAQIEKIAINRKTVLDARSAVMQLREKARLEAAAAPVSLTPDTAALAKQPAEAAPVSTLVDAVANLINTQYLPAMEIYQESQRDFVAMQEEAYEASQRAYAKRIRELMTIGAIAMALLIASIVMGAAWLIRSIRQPLMQANELAARIAQGDLSMQIDTARGDEFGDLLKSLAAMNQSLGRMVHQVRQGTDRMTTASAEIASGNNDLAQRTEQTSSNLQSTASSMDQLTSAVQQSADNARQASSLAADASSVAEKGGAVVKQVVFTMEEINVSSRKIADIISVIDGIAFQTNILALNAAVEAARAGEQGRGFAVVASEVRSLAQRSAEAAKEIKTLIGTSVDKVASGTKLVSDAGSSMHDIVQSVRKVADVIGEITAASAEQSAGIAHVNKAIGNLDQMTQQNAALVEESAAAAESLRDQASLMAQAVAVFKTSEKSSPLVARRPARDITPRPEALTSRRPPQLARARPALASPRIASPARKQIAAAPARPMPARAPASARPAKAAVEGDWETF